MLIFKTADIITSKEQVISHQCNCHSTTAKGLAKTLFVVYPYADAYSKRSTPTEAGTIQIKGVLPKERQICNMFAQVYPGRPSGRDTAEHRENLFKLCLMAIMSFNQSVEPIKSIAFPYMIGCGLARGNWQAYLQMIDDFHNESKIPVTIYRLK